MNKKTTTSEPATECLVMYGLGKDNRPHAARFDLADQKAVEKAGSLMNFRLGLAKGENLIRLAAQLPKGKIFATGRSLLPYVKPELYDQLVSQLKPVPSIAPAAPAASPEKLSGLAAVAPEAGKSGAPPSAARLPLQTTLLTNLKPEARQTFLTAWPAQDRKVPGFCGWIAALWDIVWLAGVTARFADRCRPYSYEDFDQDPFQVFAPTIAGCWRHRWIWGLFAIDRRWPLWTGIEASKDGRTISLLFDLTDLNDDRHPKLEAAGLGKAWQLKSARHYTAFRSEGFALPKALDPKAPEIAKLVALASAALGLADSLVTPPPRN
ncbi:MAG: hypothetical protein ACREHF_13630 [Rhizomicrobium sp.]